VETRRKKLKLLCVRGTYHRICFVDTPRAAEAGVVCKIVHIISYYSYIYVWRNYLYERDSHDDENGSIHRVKKKTKKREGEGI
jgi:hypothetical protein